MDNATGRKLSIALMGGMDGGIKDVTVTWANGRRVSGWVKDATVQDGGWPLVTLCQHSTDRDTQDPHVTLDDFRDVLRVEVTFHSGDVQRFE